MTPENAQVDERERELEKWQQRSESKFPPRAPRRRLHELPHLAASNEAAATPTTHDEDEIAGNGEEGGERVVTGVAISDEETPAVQGRPFVKQTVLERLENEGGTIDPEPVDTASRRNPSRRGYDIVL